MGIAGLLPLLKSITNRVHIETLAGQAVAIDAYSWLHKGVYLCAHDLFHQRHTNGYVEYCLSRINLLRKYGIKPILVFDGAPLPMKGGKENSRQKTRDESRAKANEFLEQGDDKKAAVHIHKSIDVTPDMAFKLIQELQILKVEYVVAPYEADAQMAYLDRTGKVAAIISEDSDLLLFGCKKILYKLDKHGYADEISLERIGETTGVELSGFTLERFRQMCILSGCDYFDSIPGFGLKTSHKYFAKYKTADRVLQAIRAEFPSRIPEDFERSFAKAEITFCHQRVYDDRSQEVVHLYPVTEEMILDEKFFDLGNWDFVGPHVESSVAKMIAKGEIHPVTREPFAKPMVFSQDSSQMTLSSQKDSAKTVVRSRFFQPISKEQHALNIQERLTIKPKLTSGHAEKENVQPFRLVSSARAISTLPAKRPACPQSKFFTSKTGNPASTQQSKPVKFTFTKPLSLDSAQSGLAKFWKP